jgi:hypothetical protein
MPRYASRHRLPATESRAKRNRARTTIRPARPRQAEYSEVPPRPTCRASLQERVGEVGSPVLFLVLYRPSTRHRAPRDASRRGTALRAQLTALWVSEPGAPLLAPSNLCVSESARVCKKLGNVIFSAVGDNVTGEFVGRLAELSERRTHQDSRMGAPVARSCEAWPGAKVDRHASQKSTKT